MQDRQIRVSDHTHSELYRFYMREHQREQRWRTAKIIARYVLAGLVAFGICWYALH